MPRPESFIWSRILKISVFLFAVPIFFFLIPLGPRAIRPLGGLEVYDVFMIRTLTTTNTIGARWNVWDFRF